ncbi:MAG: trigger factor [Chlorobiaceae bacterium]|nr:trigger factor [Chlorobiaceae bacterium]MBA4310484.1 trigger factor [Chlorobiaceae bacterium]
MGVRVPPFAPFIYEAILENKINILSDNESEIEVTLTYDEISSDIEKEIEKQTKKIQIDGFRKGKAPKTVIKKLFGDALEYEAAEKISNKRFWDIVKSEDIKLVGEPALVDIKFKPNENLFFKVRYETLPPLDNLVYKNLEIKVPDFQVSDNDVEQEVKRMLTSSAEYLESDSILDENYVITVDLQKLDENGNVVEGINEAGIKINLTNPNVNKELKDNSLGKKIGEFINFTFEDPHHNHKHDGDTPHDHVHEKLYYQAEIKEIKKIQLPELTEEFIKKITRDKVSTEEELRQTIRKEIENYYATNLEEMIDLQLEKEILANNSFTPPKTIIKNYLDYLVKEEIEAAKKDKKAVPSTKTLESNLEQKAINSVKWLMLRDKVMEIEKIELSEETLNALIEDDSKKMGIEVAMLKKYYESDEMKARLVGKEYYKFLRQNNNILKLTPEEFSKKVDLNNEK